MKRLLCRLGFHGPYVRRVDTIEDSVLRPSGFTVVATWHECPRCGRRVDL